MDEAARDRAGRSGVHTTVERRRAPRAPVVVRIEYETVDALFSEFTRNINEGGVFIETDAPAELESHVQLLFKLPGDEEAVKVAGRVVRIARGDADEAPGMAVEFEGLDGRDRERINRLVMGLRAGGPS
jgi:uncharacterized protein (TIGR02266 family)